MNTNNTLSLAIIAFLFGTGSTMHAQTSVAMDTIFFNNGKYIVGKVDEIGLDEIKYHGEQDDIRFAVDKESVSRVHLGSGEMVSVKKDGFSVGYRAEVLKKTQAIKIEVLSFALDHVTMSYERMLKPWMNMEVRTSFIGAGNPNMNEQCSGYAIAGGIKFINRPDHLTRGMKLGHPLHGRYVRPEILFNRFTSKSRNNQGYNWGNGSVYNNFDTTPIQYTNVAFNVILGKQRFLGDGATLDTWVGVGYAMRSVHSENAYLEGTKTYNYNFALWSESVPIALSAGISLGLAF